MLKKFKDTTGPFYAGALVYVVMPDGTIIEGHHIVSRLGELVSLNRSPLDGTEKQGFTIQDNRLLPNWCEGKRRILAVCMTRQDAEGLSGPIRERLEAIGTPRVRRDRPPRSCKEH